MLFKKVLISLSLILLINISITSIYALDIIPGGESIGIEMKYDGVMITGGYRIKKNGRDYNPLTNDFKVNDIIIAVDNKQIHNIEELTKEIKSHVPEPVTLKLIRNKNEISKELSYQFENDKFNSGLYVKDQLSGIGTITFYTKNGYFASLGHALSENDTLSCQQGLGYHCQIKAVEKSSHNQIGAKKATISQSKIGDIYLNNCFGVYGKYVNTINKTPLTVSSQDDIQLGQAYFYTEFENNKMYKCSIQITHLQKQITPQEKGITFEIDDQNVINKTNGVIQGMSGSPIIQNNKIIGCVTHACIDHPHIGYGIYIDWMLNQLNQKMGD